MLRRAAAEIGRLTKDGGDCIVSGVLTDEEIRQLEHGVRLEDGMTGPAQVKKVRKVAGIALLTAGLFGLINFMLTPSEKLPWIYDEAPALAQADVGVAMNTGTQAAREAGAHADQQARESEYEQRQPRSLCPSMNAGL